MGQQNKPGRDWRAHDNQETKTARSQNVWVRWELEKLGNRREEKGLERSKMGVGYVSQDYSAQILEGRDWGSPEASIDLDMLIGTVVLN